MSNDYRLNLLSEELDRYKAVVLRLTEENERLREENKKIEKWLERYKNANERLHNIQVDDFNLTKTKYRQALEEIREDIQSLNKDICNNCGWHNTDSCSPNGYVCHDLIEIQNKISEVLE